MEEKLYTVEEVAAYLKISEYTVRRHLLEGLLKGLKIGKAWRITEKALHNYIHGEGDQN